MIGYKQNVLHFYEWFTKNEEQVRKWMDQGKNQEAYQMVASEMDKVFHGLLFEIHADESNQRYLLEFTTFLDDRLKVICFDFCEEMPKVLKDKWSFTYYHPALKGSVHYQGKSYSAHDFQIVPTFNKKNNKITITVQNGKDFKGMSDQDKFMITYMILSDYIGEMCVDAYIGGISFGRNSFFKKQQEVVELPHLFDKITEEVKNHGLIQPNEIKLIASSFKSKKSNSVAERKDFVQGFSYCLDLLNEEGTDNTDLGDYVKSLGIGIYSICTKKDLTDDTTSKKRKETVEKELSTILSQNKSGFIIHSIEGVGHDYADFFLYDPNVLETIQKKIISQSKASTLITL